MKSSLSDICHTPNRNFIFCICHTLENKAAVAKSKLQPLHWQQRERPALRKVCLGRNIMAIFLISEESKNGSKGRSFLTKCLYGWKKWWWFTLICSRSRNASLQCSQPRRCHPGKPPGHQPIPWDFVLGYIVICCNWMNLTLQCDESVGLRELPEIMLDWYLI